jgi:hypothetical protein
MDSEWAVDRYFLLEILGLGVGARGLDVDCLDKVDSKFEQGSGRREG